MDENMRAELCAATVENAAAAYPDFDGAVLHSDRGSQYTSELYRCSLNEFNVRQSMNSVEGRCHDNARCESIRGLVTRMKNELFYSRGRRSTDYTTEQLKTMIWRYYMSCWNNRRICSSIALLLKIFSYIDHISFLRFALQTTSSISDKLTIQMLNF